MSKIAVAINSLCPVCLTHRFSLRACNMQTFSDDEKSCLFLNSVYIFDVTTL